MFAQRFTHVRTMGQSRRKGYTRKSHKKTVKNVRSILNQRRQVNKVYTLYDEILRVINKIFKMTNYDFMIKTIFESHYREQLKNRTLQNKEDFLRTNIQFAKNFFMMLLFKDKYIIDEVPFYFISKKDVTEVIKENVDLLNEIVFQPNFETEMISIIRMSYRDINHNFVNRRFKKIQGTAV